MLPKRNYAEMIIILLGVTWYCLGSLLAPLIVAQDFWLKAILLLLLFVMIFDILIMIYWR